MSRCKRSNYRLIDPVSKGRIENLEMVINLLNISSIDSIEDSNGLTLLCIASDKGHLQVAEYLLTHGASANFHVQRNGYSPLHFAVKRDYKDIAKLLLSRGANVNARGSRGITPLHIAVERGYFQISKLLLKSGADTKLKYFKGYFRKKCCTPLHLAAKKGYERIVQLLLEHRTVVNIVDKDLDAAYALHTACHNGRKELVKFLLQSVPVDFKDAYSNTPLHLATKKGFSDIIEILLTSSADIESRDKFGRTALHIATARNFVEVIIILLKYEADIESTDACGRTSLHIASEEGHIKVTKTLLKYGSDINRMSKYNHVPLDFAIFDICSQCVEYTYSNKNWCYNAYRWSYNREEIAEMLKQHILKMKIANLYVCKKNLELIGCGEDVINFQAQCEKEMERLKSTKITSNVTFHDIVTKSINQVAVYVGNKNVVDFLNLYDYRRKFPMYCTLIDNRYIEGGIRKDLLQPCYKFFQLLCRLPSQCTEKILSYLSNRDIKFFVDTFKSDSFSIHNIK